METTIVLIGMLLPIAAASIFYAGDKRGKRFQQSDATSAATPKTAVSPPASPIADVSPVGMAPVETALENTTGLATATAADTTAGESVDESRTAA